jgi:hypothetical protein
MTSQIQSATEAIDRATTCTAEEWQVLQSAYVGYAWVRVHFATHEIARHAFLRRLVQTVRLAP